MTDDLALSSALGNLPRRLGSSPALAPWQDLAEFRALKSAATTIQNFYGDNHPSKVEVEKPLS